MSTWVWYSTEASRAESKISILAIAETLFFVLLTWGVAFYFNFYYYLFVPLILTPFLMLKTPESIQMSHRIFLYEIDVKSHRILVWSIVLIVFVMGFLLAYVSLSEVLNSFIYKIIFLEMFILICLFSFFYKSFFYLFKNKINIKKNVGKENVNKKSLPIYLGLLFSIFIIPLAIGTLLRSLVVKTLSTTSVLIKSPVYTLSYITSNWYEQNLVYDILYSPELLPEIGNYRKGLQLYWLINSLKTSNISDKIALVTLVPFWSLTYLYRWSIKSTAWFYWPLAFIFNKRPLDDKIKGKTHIDDQTNALTLKGHIVIGTILLIYFMGSIVSLDKIENVESNVGVIIEIFRSISINHPSIKTIIQPETWWLVLSATGLYFILYGFSSLQQHRRMHNNPEYSETFTTILHWFIRLKNVLWIAFFAINLFFIANQHVWPLIFNFFRSV